MNEQNNRVQAVIFDVDGTLIDTNDLHARAWQMALREFGHDIPYDEIRQQIGKGGDQFKPVFLSEEENKRIGKQLDERKKQIFFDHEAHKMKSFPDVRELFTRIRESGKQIALATSAAQDELDEYKKRLHIEDLIDCETTKSDVEKSKPHPDVFKAALDKLQLDDSNCAIVVGDTPWDVEAAHKAELRTVGLLSGGFDEQQLRSAGAVAIYKDPADLLAHFEDSPLAA